MYSVNKGVLIPFFLSVMLFASCKEKMPAAEARETPAPPQAPVHEKASLPGIDKSPMDMSYYPVDYPVLKMSGKLIGLPVARVIYSRPARDGRKIFGNLVKYGSAWRLGANEATEIEFFKDVSINSKPVKKGRYVLYCIPFEDKWTLILNEDLFTWGLKINPARDVYSFDVPITTVADEFEVFTMQFLKAGAGIELIMEWDHVRALLRILY